MNIISPSHRDVAVRLTARSSRVLACGLAIAAGFGGLSAPSPAADVIKADNTDALNATTSWSLGVVPTAADVGVWDNTVTGANSVALGGDLSWQGIRIADPGGAVAITAGNTLTLGTAGIDMSAATQDLSIASGVTLGSGQSWTIDTGRTLAVSGAIGETGGAQGLTKAGDGTLTLTGGNSYTGTTTVSAGTLSLGNGTTSGSLPDASAISIASGAEFHWNRPSNDITFANSISGSGTFAKSGGELGLTGSNNLSGTLEIRGGKLGAEGANSLGGNPALVVTAGTLSLGGGYSGATATVSSLSGAGRIDGIFGAGATRTLRVDQAGDTEFSGTFAAISGTRVVALEKAGAGTLTLSGGNNAYSAADVTIDGGTLQIGATESSTTIFSSATRTVTVNSGATLAFVYRNAFGTVGSTPNTTVVVDGGTVVTSNGTTGAVNVLRDLTLRNGATLEATKNYSPYQTYQLTGTVTVDGATASSITSGAGNGGVAVGNGVDDDGITTFNVADVTSSSAADLTISAVIGNSDASGQDIGGLTKSGAGSLFLTAANSYTGVTTVSAGSLVIGDGGTSGSLNDGSDIVIDSGATLHWNRSNSDLGFGNAISGSGTFLKSGGGEIGLTGSTTFSGLFDIQAGKIGLPSATSVDGAPSVNLAAGGTLSLGTGFSGGTATIGNLSGSGTVDTAFGGSNDTRTLSVNQSSDTTFSGTLADASSRLLALTKTGSAKLTLDGTNTYTGATTIAAGTLALGSSGSLASPLIDIASGATFDVSAVPGFTLTSGQRLGGAGSVLGDLAFGSGSTLAFSTTDTLAVSSGTISFATGFGLDDLFGLDGTLVSEGTYTLISGSVDLTGMDNVGFANRASIGGGKEAYFASGSLNLVVVPEPATLGLAGCGLVAAALAAYHRARRRKAA